MTLPSFPFLLPEDEHLKYYHGYLFLNEEQFRVRIRNPCNVFPAFVSHSNATTISKTSSSSSSSAATQPPQAGSHCAAGDTVSGVTSSVRSACTCCAPLSLGLELQHRHPPQFESHTYVSNAATPLMTLLPLPLQPEGPDTATGVVHSVSGTHSLGPIQPRPAYLESKASAPAVSDASAVAVTQPDKAAPPIIAVPVAPLARRGLKRKAQGVETSSATEHERRQTEPERERLQQLAAPLDSRSGQVSLDMTARDSKSSSSSSSSCRGSLPTLEMQCDARLHDLLCSRHILNQLQLRWVESAGSLHAFLTELAEIVARQLKRRRQSKSSVSAPAIASTSSASPLSSSSSSAPSESASFTALHTAAFYSLVCSQLAAVGWARVDTVSETLTHLRLMTTDAAARKHYLAVKLSDDYPNSPPECTVDLPVPFQFAWGGTNKESLKALLQQFDELVDSLQDFCLCLDDIDAHCNVLDASVKTVRASVARRISIELALSSSRPRSLCECRLFGAESFVQPLRTRLSSVAAQLWSLTDTPRCNLERVLELKFPSSPAATASTLSVKDAKANFKPGAGLGLGGGGSQAEDDSSCECGLCYSYRLGESFPDRVCDNPSCARPFHDDCLYEWLRSVPTARRSFNTIFGTCPYCTEPLVVNVRTASSS